MKNIYKYNIYDITLISCHARLQLCAFCLVIFQFLKVIFLYFHHCDFWFSLDMCSFSENIRKIISTALCSICSSSALGRCDEKKGASYVLDEPYTVICFLFHETRFLTKSFWGENSDMLVEKISPHFLSEFENHRKSMFQPIIKAQYLLNHTSKQTGKHITLFHIQRRVEWAIWWSGSVPEAKTRRRIQILEWILRAFKNTFLDTKAADLLNDRFNYALIRLVRCACSYSTYWFCYNVPFLWKH